MVELVGVVPGGHIIYADRVDPISFATSLSSSFRKLLFVVFLQSAATKRDCQTGLRAIKAIWADSLNVHSHPIVVNTDDPQLRKMVSSTCDNSCVHSCVDIAPTPDPESCQPSLSFPPRTPDTYSSKETQPSTSIRVLTCRLSAPRRPPGLRKEGSEGRLVLYHITDEVQNVEQTTSRGNLTEYCGFGFELVVSPFDPRGIGPRTNGQVSPKQHMVCVMRDEPSHTCTRSRQDLPVSAIRLQQNDTVQVYTSATLNT